MEELIKCKCGKLFNGWNDKEDTCPECLRNLFTDKSGGIWKET